MNKDVKKGRAIMQNNILKNIEAITEARGEERDMEKCAAKVAHHFDATWKADDAELHREVKEAIAETEGMWTKMKITAKEVKHHREVTRQNQIGV